MKHTSTLAILPEAIAQTPRHLGVNIEVQEHADATNLWDWVADSGITVAREFHPEVNMRKSPVAEDAWGTMDTADDFAAFRARVVADPQHGGILWDNYRFAERVPWMGVPDDIARKMTELGVQPLYSIGYATGMYPRPLVKDLHFTGTPTDDMIDWGAAASAYDYYFAMMYHFATQFGARYFTMVNEPENRWGWFHLPPELEGGDDRWLRFFWNEGEDAELGQLYLGVLSAQYAVMARIARMALENVRGLLGEAPNASALFLSGPTTVTWEALWEKAAPYLDACDYHHYHPEAHTFAMVHPRAAQLAKAAGKAVAISEFNRYSGGIPMSRNLFILDNALETGALLMTVLGLNRPDDPDFEFATLYLLHYPSTHRNYKHLLYGDMNLVDWSGRDTPLRNRGDAWYPTFEELQVRFATPAYHIFRMCVRAAGGGIARPVLRTALTNPTSSGPEDLYDQLSMLVSDKGERLIVTILNRGAETARNVVVDVSAIDRPFAWAVQRETSRERQDGVVGEWPMEGGRITVDIAGRSMTQLIISQDALAEATPLRMEECTHTPGSAAGLALHQTTRLRAIARVGAHERDLTTHNVIWESSHPGIIAVSQSGLVQRLRHAPEAVTITARTPSGAAWPAVVIPGSE